mmetsp:Transcript_34086/g.29896  ORF Transcript_34086/g.29896 Transcript_34086/m.29896 type:complete len:95 (+) Transcript_34086:43-327(+)
MNGTLYRGLIHRAGYSARVIGKPNITYNHSLLWRQTQKRSYYQWMFGYDGIDDSLKRNPRSFWVRLAQSLWTIGVCGLSAVCVYKTGSSDWKRF